MAANFRRAVLLGVLGLFILFLYGPTLTILVLSFQGPDGGLTFPMNGLSVHWFRRLFETQAVGDFGGSLARSFALATMVMVTTVVISLAAGMAFRRRFKGSGALFTLSVASLIIPSILVSLGVGLLFNELGFDPDWYSSAFGAQLSRASTQGGTKACILVADFLLDPPLGAHIGHLLERHVDVGALRISEHGPPVLGRISRHISQRRRPEPVHGSEVVAVDHH